MRAGTSVGANFLPTICADARQSDDADHTRRLLSIAEILDGGSRSDAARTGGVGLQVIRDWVLLFNEGGPEALRTLKAPGKPPILTDEQRQRLASAVEAGPKPYLDGVVRWRLVDLVDWLREEFYVSISRAPHDQRTKWAARHCLSDQWRDKARLRRDLPGDRQGSRVGHALGRHPCHGRTPEADQF